MNNFILFVLSCLLLYTLTFIGCRPRCLFSQEFFQWTLSCTEMSAIPLKDCALAVTKIGNKVFQHFLVSLHCCSSQIARTSFLVFTTTWVAIIFCFHFEDSHMLHLYFLFLAELAYVLPGICLQTPTPPF